MRVNEPICQSRWSAPLSLLMGVIALIAAAVTVEAGEIFKSVDANGRVVYSDHLDPSLSQSSLVQLDNAGLPPSKLHFCWTNCFTLILDNGIYRREDGTAESWTVETFSSDAIVLHRHDAPADWNGYHEDVVYAGRVADDRLVGVTVNGTPTSGIDASWGTALNTLPGNDAERDGKAPVTVDSGSTVPVSSASVPPPLPEEDQPVLPDDGLLWTPGYWYWRDQRYVWIPGVWTRPLRIGFLWTPAYWSKAGAVYVFHPGHWGSVVGFYGGLNYGFGYFGNGYTGGHWIVDSFAYNTALNHIDRAVAHHTYAQSVSGQIPRGVLSYTATSRSADSTLAGSRRPGALDAARTTPARAPDGPHETARISTKKDGPATVTKTPTTRALRRSTHLTPGRGVRSR